jgi:hypothetical protein
MARQIVLSLDGEISSFGFTKVERTKLYGRRRRVPLDADGQPCGRGELTSDGELVLRAGMSTLAWYDEAGNLVDSSAVVGLDAQGNPVPRVESTLGDAVAVVASSPEELLDHRITSVYQLDPAELGDGLAAAVASGTIFRFDFKYVGGFGEADHGFLVANAQSMFALVGRPAPPEWLGLTTVAAPTADDDDDDDLDFEMF